MDNIASNATHEKINRGKIPFRKVDACPLNAVKIC
jgi:hypothetical protein